MGNKPRLNGFYVATSLVAILFLSACSSDPSSPDVSDSLVWETSTPAAQGLDAEAIDRAFVEADSRNFINSIVIARNGFLVAEKYFNGMDENSAHNVKSVSKSFLSAFIGIALREGFIDSLDERVLDYFSEYPLEIEGRKADITIRHLLQMRAGIGSDENLYSQIYASSNWIKTTLEQPLLSDPGAQFRYNTFQTHLLSAILTKASGMNSLAFANRYLLGPMQISCRDWQTGPQGYYFGGNNMFFTTRDMARLGFLYLNQGMIAGNQIVQADWVEGSLRNYTGWENSNWGSLKNVNYGYLWWLGAISGYEVFLAIGHGGQFIVCFPALNMIIATTSNSNVPWDQADAQERSVLQLLEQHILVALVN